jgi:hypothetical protein
MVMREIPQDRELPAYRVHARTNPLFFYLQKETVQIVQSVDEFKMLLIQMFESEQPIVTPNQERFHRIDLLIMSILNMYKICIDLGLITARCRCPLRER